MGKAFHQLTTIKTSSNIPIYGKCTIDTTHTNGKYVAKDGYHCIAPFRLKDQQGSVITRNDLNGKIYVANFFYSTCTSICPIMSDKMEEVYRLFENNPEVAFVSHTVNPSYDTVPILAAYAQARGAKAGKWYFLTGDKKELYDLARNSYMLSSSIGDGGVDDFVHTQKFALIDKEKHIRGFYNGIDQESIDSLIKDMRTLLKEYH